MPRNFSIVNNNSFTKNTFKSYIDLESIGETSDGAHDEVWTTLDSSGVNDLINDKFSKNELGRKESIKSKTSTKSLLNETIEGVNYFHLLSKRTTGICGRLILTSIKMTFESYNNSNCSYDECLPSFLPFLQNSTLSPNLSSSSSSSSSQSTSVTSSPPIIDIYLLNIGDIQDILSPDGNFLILTIYCTDFRCIEFQMRNTEQTNRIIEKLRYLSSNGVINGKISKLTQSLKDNYGYIFKADWDWYEGHWWQCYKLRVTQCNESFQLCDSLPSSFIVPKSLNDATLLNTISPQIKGQRVPIVTFLYSQNGHMLIRSASFDYYENLNQVFQGLITQLRELNIDSMLPPLNAIDIAYNRLREACYQYNDSSGFHSKISKWISSISLILKTVNKVFKILTEEASVGLIEDDDRHWNCVISALTQLMIDPKRRTFAGFESLISKEFIYLSGYAYRIHSPKNPNHILFTLFLDCVFQLMIQNPNSFEFSSFYLIWLFDCQFMQLPISSTQGSFTSSSMKFDLQIAPPILHQLSLKQLMLLHNPFYKQNLKYLQLNSHICEIQFWSSLYLRWHSKSVINCHLKHETLYLMELQSRFR